MVLVKARCVWTFCVHKQGIRRDLRPRLQTPVHRQTEQGCAQALPFARKTSGQTAHAKTRYGVCGELFALGGA